MAKKHRTENLKVILVASFMNILTVTTILSYLFKKYQCLMNSLFFDKKHARTNSKK